MVTENRRITFWVNEKLFNEVNEITKWGEKSDVLRIMCEDLVLAVKEHGRVVVDALNNRQLQIQDFVKVPKLTLSEYLNWKEGKGGTD